MRRARFFATGQTDTRGLARLTGYRFAPGENDDAHEASSLEGYVSATLGTPSGTGGFRDLDADATTYDLGEGLLVRVVSLDDLIRMKEAASRPKDEAHLHVLSALKQRIQERGN